MSSSTLPTPGATDSHGCSHCDTSVPHEHLDVRSELDAAARRSRRRSWTLTALALAPLVAGLVVALLSGDAVPALALTGLVAAGWLVAAAFGVTAARSLAGRSTRLAVAAGAATTAALGPVVGLAAGWLTDPGPLSALLVAGGAWWTASAAVDHATSATWRRTLFLPGEEAERARVQAISGRADSTVVTLAWLVQGPAVGVAAILSGPPALAVLLLAALCAALSVRGSAHRA